MHRNIRDLRARDHAAPEAGWTGVCAGWSCGHWSVSILRGEDERVAVRDAAPFRARIEPEETNSFGNALSDLRVAGGVFFHFDVSDVAARLDGELDRDLASQRGIA